MDDGSVQQCPCNRIREVVRLEQLTVDTFSFTAYTLQLKGTAADDG